MRRIAAVLFAILAAALVVAGCGGGSQRAYKTPYGPAAHSPTFGLPPTSARLTLPLATAQPTVEMRDSVAVSAIPSGTRAVAGYTSGFWPTYSGLVRAFPRAYHVSIAISVAHHADCLDVEPGDASPSQSGAWVRADIAAGFKRPCVYANLATMPAVKASLAGMARSQYLLWDADWTFRPHLDAGYDATQWTDHGPQGQNYDESTASYGFLRIPVAHPTVLPVCYHHRISRSECSATRRKVASDLHAVAASERAYVAQGCSVLSQRVRWFGTQLRKRPHVKSRARSRALGASQRAFRQRGCPVFAQRARWFAAAAARIRAAS